jgi:signal transduction histidine kinase
MNCSTRDDGRGAELSRLALLRAALETQNYEGQTGLGLMLADLVARAHGGRLVLPDTPSGFAVELVLSPTSGLDAPAGGEGHRACGVV